MRLLVDNALSPALAVLLTDASHDAVDVRSLNLQHAYDIAIFERAAGDDRVVVSADTDFGTLLATRSARKPSVIQFRGPGSRKPDALARTLLSNLAKFSKAPFKVASRWFEGACEIQTYELDELLATRLRALYQRKPRG